MSAASVGYPFALAAVAAAAGYAAYRLGDLTLAAGAGVVAAYTLHLLSLRRVRGRCQDVRRLDRLATELEGTVASETFVVRRFTPPTVALIEGMMDPGEVVRTLGAADDEDDGFGRRALEKGYLSEKEARALAAARREARFLTDQVRLARRKLRRYREENGAG